ncbi:unnamed protein product [Linum trigynum]|uniref:Uncharacterized protein n=1 Tax=Linum trigynum TaxID=586398 RepID=A0AAV2E3Y6_9ROSI
MEPRTLNYMAITLHINREVQVVEEGFELVKVPWAVLEGSSIENPTIEPSRVPGYWIHLKEKLRDLNHLLPRQVPAALMTPKGYHYDGRIKECYLPTLSMTNNLIEQNNYGLRRVATAHAYLIEQAFIEDVLLPEPALPHQ